MRRVRGRERAPDTLTSRMTLSRLWTGIVGAARWVACVPADATEAQRRAGICAACPSMVRARVLATGHVAGFCGKPLTETDQTCGCLVLWGATDRPDHAAGKCTCDPETCPQGRWATTTTVVDAPVTLTISKT